MIRAFGCQLMEVQMEINMSIPADYCQGNAEHLDIIESEEYEIPSEDQRVRKIRSIKVQCAE